MTPTPEQAAIYAASRTLATSLMINALAGTGKTTTLVAAAELFPRVPTLALAFNVKIKKELEIRLPSHMTVKTLNGLGHAAWGKTLSKRLELDDKKLGKIVTRILSNEPPEVSRELWPQVLAVTSAALRGGLVPAQFPKKGLLPDTDDIWEELCDDAIWEVNPGVIQHSKAVLVKNITDAIAGTISFDDQIYMSALFGGTFDKFGLVLVDEAQDLSPLNHRQIALSLRNESKLIVCGDPKQAIYAFRGADSASMEKLRALRAEWQEFPLSTTFRCAKVIVERQHYHAPNYVAHSSNSEGHFFRFTEWSWDTLKQHQIGDLAIICRNNAPLVSMAYALLKSGIPVQMLGRDIGKSLISLSKKIFPQDDIPIPQCITLIHEYFLRDIEKAEARGQEARVEALQDRRDSLLAFCDHISDGTSGTLRTTIADLFAKGNPRVTLCTAHRSKGLEWGTVLHLNPHLLPSKMAHKALSAGNPTPMQQETNLQYVLETRAKSVLIEGNLDDFIS